jgi:hypothetical protein
MRGRHDDPVAGFAKQPSADEDALSSVTEVAIDVDGCEVRLTPELLAMSTSRDLAGEWVG